MSLCASCGRELCADEIGLTKKLINRGTSRFYCLTCLASKFECSEALLQSKVEQFRRQGCSLFTD